MSAKPKKQQSLRESFHAMVHNELLFINTTNRPVDEEYVKEFISELEQMLIAHRSKELRN